MSYDPIRPQMPQMAISTTDQGHDNISYALLFIGECILYAVDTWREWKRLEVENKWRTGNG